MLVAGPETAQGCSVSNIKNAQSVKLYTVRSVWKWRMRENAKKTKLRLSFTDWATSNVQPAKYLCPRWKDVNMSAANVGLISAITAERNLAKTHAEKDNNGTSKLS